MKTVIVKSKDISKFQRLDAGFFITLNKFKDEVAKLKLLHTKDEVIELLNRVEDKDKKCLSLIGTGYSLNIEKISKDYPFLSLVLVKAELLRKIDLGTSKIETMRIKINKDQEYLEFLSKIENS